MNVGCVHTLCTQAQLGWKTRAMRSMCTWKYEINPYVHAAQIESHQHDTCACEHYCGIGRSCFVWVQLFRVLITSRVHRFPSLAIDEL